MKKYVAPRADTEVIGHALIAFEHSSEREAFLEVLKRHHLEQVDPEAWYLMQITLDVQKEIKSGSGGMQAMVSIGMAVINAARFPPMNSIEDAIMGFAGTYPMNFRNIDPSEGISAEKVAERKIKVVNHSPHSDDMVYGYIFALIHRFKPEGTSPTVEFEDYSLCDSDASTVFWVTW
jgi:hypothetical protein